MGKEQLTLEVRKVIALEKVAAMLDELGDEIAGGFAVLTDSVDDLARTLRRKNDDE